MKNVFFHLGLSAECKPAPISLNSHAYLKNNLIEMFANHLTLLRKSIANIYEKEITYRYLKQRAQFNKEQYFRTSRPLTAMRTRDPSAASPRESEDKWTRASRP